MQALTHTEFAALLARAGVSQAAFARLAGLSPRQVNNWARADDQARRNGGGRLGDRGKHRNAPCPTSWPANPSLKRSRDQLKRGRKIDKQGTDPQLDELRAAGCTTILEEHASGADRSRPVLARLLRDIAAR
jgi:hypothetical protein